MQYPRIWPLIALVAGAAVILIAPGNGSADSRVDVEEIIPALASAQTENDSLSEEVNIDGLGDIQTSTIRRAASDERASYWVARSGTSNLCLIVHLQDGYDVAGSSCAPITQMYQNGLGMALQEGGNPERSVEAYLLPDDIDLVAFGETHPDFMIDTSNGSAIAIFHAREGMERPSSLEPSRIERTGRSDFEFTPLLMGSMD